MTQIDTGSVTWWIALFGKAKRYRRVFTRFEQLGRRCLGFWHFVAALIRLR